jgi:hypothetical protein
VPDLDIVTAWTCCSNTSWTHEVRSDSGNTYTVRFEPRPWPHEVQYDYTCTCKAFTFGKGKYCKHIESVKHLRCGWNAELEPSAQPDSGEPDNRPVCPSCGEEAVPIQVGV